MKDEMYPESLSFHYCNYISSFSNVLFYNFLSFSFLHSSSRTKPAGILYNTGLSLQQAYSLMKTRRPLIRPNDGFWRQLIQYEKQLKKQKVGASLLINLIGVVRYIQRIIICKGTETFAKEPKLAKSLRVIQ